MCVIQILLCIHVHGWRGRAVVTYTYMYIPVWSTGTKKEMQSLEMKYLSGEYTPFDKPGPGPSTTTVGNDASASLPNHAEKRKRCSAGI